MWNTGHALVKAKLKETGAPLAGEMSGHTFFKERWYGFDDGLHRRPPARNPQPGGRCQSGAEEPAELALHPGTEHQDGRGRTLALIDKLKAEGQFEGAEQIVTIDGVRVEYADGFGLARPSNTTPVVVLRFEADNAVALERIQAGFRQAISPSGPASSYRSGSFRERRSRRPAFLGRQPILDREQRLHAYELLFRSGSRNFAEVTDGVQATATVIANAFSELGIEAALGNTSRLHQC